MCLSLNFFFFIHSSVGIDFSFVLCQNIRYIEPYFKTFPFCFTRLFTYSPLHFFVRQIFSNNLISFPNICRCGRYTCSSLVHVCIFHYWTIGVLGFDSRLRRLGFFSLHHRVQNGSGVHPASYPMGTRGSFPDGKMARL
jgi:hypothetical protein